MSNNSHLTAKQIELMRVIAARNPDGSAVDLDQILDTIRYLTTKPSLQFSIRALIKRGLIVKGAREKRRGAVRQLIEATELGKFYAGMGPRRPVELNPVVELGVDLGVEAGLDAAAGDALLPDLGSASALQLPDL